MAAPAQLDQVEETWVQRREVGSTFGIRALVAFAHVFGRTGARAVLRGIALYYAVFGTAARRASRAYLTRVLGRATWSMVYRHISMFTQVALDRVFLVEGELRHFESTHTGHDHLVDLHEAKRGAILLGAHLGSFEAMRALSKYEGIKINVLVHFENARRINAFLETVNPDFMLDVIEIDPKDPAFVLEVQEAVEAGEMVAILGDRVGLGEKSVEVEFFGSAAKFPTGPFTLAAALRCPIYLTFGLYHPPGHYDLYCEPFADGIELPRKTRDDDVKAWVQRWAGRLEHYCRKAPYNWFNFYEFWSR